jgi:hypothetical protein
MDVSGGLQAPAALPSQNEAPAPIEQEAEWATESAWTLWIRGKQILAPAGNWTTISRTSAP